MDNEKQKRKEKKRAMKTKRFYTKKWLNTQSWCLKIENSLRWSIKYSLQLQQKCIFPSFQFITSEKGINTNICFRFKNHIVTIVS